MSRRLSIVVGIVVVLVALAAGFRWGRMGEHPLVDAGDHAWADAHGPIRIATGPGAPPAYMPDATGAMENGFLIDLVGTAADRLGIDITFVPFDTLSEAVDAVIRGETDLILAAERPDLLAAGMASTTPFAWPPLVVISENPDIVTFDDLTGRRISTIPGSPMEVALHAKLPAADYVEMPTASAALDALLSGDLDAYLGSMATISYLTRESGADLHVVGEPLGIIGPTVYGPAGSPQLRLLEAARRELSDDDLRASHIRWAGVDLTLDRPDHDPPVWPQVAGATVLVVAMVAVWVRRERRFRALATTDPLTGLPNRTSLLDGVDASLEQARRVGRTVALLFVDLDGFKDVNDSFGHHIGDHVLIEVTNRLRQQIRPQDAIGRFGGDEFVVLVDDLAPATASRVVGRIAASMCAAVSEPVSTGGRLVGVGASVGVAFATAGATSADLLRRADAAMYDAKRAGKNQWRAYHDDLDVGHGNFNLRTELPRLVADGSIVVEYQTIVDADGVPVGAEALARLLTPDGLLGPTGFVDIAEETGDIVSLGAEVLRKATTAAAGWRSKLFVSVNVAPQQLVDPLFGAVVRDALSRSGLDPGRLMLELTESWAVDLDSGDTLDELRRLGVMVALDDFGTGASSLTRLRRLPLTHVKLDASFVEGLHDPSANTLTVLRAVASIAAEWDLVVIHEGVETEAQAALVRSVGPSLQQGFLYARPAPTPSFEAADRPARPSGDDAAR